MKANWRECFLGDVLTLQRGFDLPERDRVHGKVPIVSSSGTTGYHNSIKVKAPGVVTGRYGTLGEIFYITKDFWPLNTTLYVKEFKGNYPLFIAYFLRTLNFYSQNSAGAVPGVNRNHLHMMKVRVPPLPTQRKIASILSAYDDLIENNTRRIAMLEEMAQRIYKEWFVNFRFPEHENAKFVDSPLGKIPEGWRVEKLKNVAEVNARSIKKGNEPDSINYIDIASVSTGSVDAVQAMSFSEAPGRARRIIRHGDIIWSTVRPNRKSYSLILNPLQNMIASTGFAVISGITAPHSYLYYALTTDGFVGYLVSNATGSAYPAVSSADFEKAAILIPSTNILQKFDEFVEPLLVSNYCFARKNTSLRTTRDLLLPKLISGRLDVEDLDIDTLETLVDDQT